MPTPVVMPQMGESIAEGTIVRWIKKVGDSVDRDEPLFEISTDKVDAEIPSPAAGILTEIAVKEGETVAVNSVVATIGQEGETAAAAKPASAVASRKGAERAAASTQPQPDGSSTAGTAAAVRVSPATGGSPKVRATRSESAAEPSAESVTEPSKEDVRRQKSSPLVRRIAKEHDVDIRQIAGSGIGGRVTKHDILDFIDSGLGTRDSGLGTGDSGVGTRDSGLGTRDSGVGTRDSELAAGVSGAESRAPGSRVPDPGSRVPDPEYRVPGSPVPDPQSRVQIQPLSVMRKKIAEHMILSRRTSAHVHSVFHVNFSTVEKIRQQKKAEYERAGAKLTYMAFIAKAVIDALRRHPIINASLDGDNIIYKKDIHLGVAVALESGLIVPVIKNADERNILGLSRAIADVAERARAKQLKPDEVHGGTFTITNPGQFGAQFGMPIINQPQVAILGIGTIEKRPIVVDDAIAIRPMAYLTLGYDHRLVDGAIADQFMSDVKNQIESFDGNQV